MLAPAAVLLSLLAAPALAQTSVTQNPPVPSRPPVTGPAGSNLTGRTRPPPDQLAAPSSSTAGPGLAGGGAGAPLSGPSTQVPIQPPGRR